MGEDRPKRSWREIDQQRDGSSRNERADRKLKDPRSQRSYRAKLDRLFDSGKIGTLLSDDLSAGEDAPPGIIQLTRAVERADGRDAITKAIDALVRASAGKLPQNTPVLTKALEHRDEDVQLDALRALPNALETDPPRRVRALVAQLKLLRDTSETPEIVDAARDLVERVEML